MAVIVQNDNCLLPVGKDPRWSSWSSVSLWVWPALWHFHPSRQPDWGTPVPLRTRGNEITNGHVSVYARPLETPFILVGPWPWAISCLVLGVHILFSVLLDYALMLVLWHVCSTRLNYTPQNFLSSTWETGWKRLSPERAEGELQAFCSAHTPSPRCSIKHTSGAVKGWRLQMKLKSLITWLLR